MKYQLAALTRHRILRVVILNCRGHDNGSIGVDVLGVVTDVDRNAERGKPPRVVRLGPIGAHNFLTASSEELRDGHHAGAANTDEMEFHRDSSTRSATALAPLPTPDARRISLRRRSSAVSSRGTIAERTASGLNSSLEI